MKNEKALRRSFLPASTSPTFASELYPDSKVGERLCEQGAKKVRDQDRKNTDDTGRVHHPGPGK